MKCIKKLRKNSKHEKLVVLLSFVTDRLQSDLKVKFKIAVTCLLSKPTSVVVSIFRCFGY